MNEHSDDKSIKDTSCRNDIKKNEKESTSEDSLETSKQIVETITENAVKDSKPLIV